MRGSDPKQDGMFSYVSPEQRVPAEHPLRPLRTMVDDILKEMSPRFAKLYADRGGRRFHPSGYCAPCCCRSYTRCAASGC